MRLGCNVVKPFDELYTKLPEKKGKQIMDDPSHPQLSYLKYFHPLSDCSRFIVKEAGT